MRGEQPNTVARRKLMLLLARQHGFLGLDLGDAVARNRAQRRVFGAKFSLFADAIAAVGDRHDDPLLLAGEAANHFDRFLVRGPGGHGVGVAERHADERGQRNDQIGLGDERLDAWISSRQSPRTT